MNSKETSIKKLNESVNHNRPLKSTPSDYMLGIAIPTIIEQSLIPEIHEEQHSSMSSSVSISLNSSQIEKKSKSSSPVRSHSAYLDRKRLLNAEAARRSRCKKASKIKFLENRIQELELLNKNLETDKSRLQTELESCQETVRKLKPPVSQVMLSQNTTLWPSSSSWNFFPNE